MTTPVADKPFRFSDDDLMAKVQAGDGEAFGEVYDRFCQRALCVARAICGDAGRAEDAVQEAFVAAWRSSAKYQPERGSLGAWLLAITRHRAIDVARAHATHSKRRSAEEQLVSVPTLDDVAGEAVEHADKHDLRTQLADLPGSQRDVIILAFFGQLTHTEIAHHLELPEGTVKGRMRLGLQKLHDAQVTEAETG